MYHLQGWSTKFCWFFAIYKNTTIYLDLATLTLQKHPKMSILSSLRPTKLATPLFEVHFGSEVAPCTQFPKATDAKGNGRKKTLLPPYNVEQNIASKSQGPQNYEDHGQEGTHVSSKSYGNRA